MKFPLQKEQVHIRPKFRMQNKMDASLEDNSFTATSNKTQEEKILA